MRIKKSIKYIAIQLIMLMAMATSQAQQVEVVLQVFPPHQLNLDGLTNQLLATVRNTGGQTIMVNFRFNMTGPEGLQITSDRVFEDNIELGPGAIEQFRGGDWDDLFESVNLRITPESESIHLENEQAFRGGDYKICLVAYNPNTNVTLSLGDPKDCVEFPVEVGDIPEIISPMGGANIDIDSAPLQVTWMHINVSSGSIEYELKIVDATENPGLTDAELFSLGIVEFQEENIMGLSFPVEEEDMEWIEGHEYVVRVTAIDTEGSISFENSGHSLPVRFLVGDPSEDVVSLDVVPHYPMDRDTIPFLTFPLVVAFSPQSPTISRMDFSAVFNGGSPILGDLRWNETSRDNGALGYLQEKGFPEATWEQAVLQPLMDVESSSVQRAGRYTWSSEVTLYENFSAQDAINTPTQEFVVGMPRPVHESPPHNATVPAGEINFQWLTSGEQPSRIIPDYELFHIDARGTHVARLGNVHEHWVLQVFSENNTDKEHLVKQYDGRLDATSAEFFDPITRRFDEQKLSQKLYAALNHTFTITEEGTYWWRIAWLRNPDMSHAALEILTEEQVYHNNSLRPFNIGAPDVAVEEEDTECTSTCIIEAPNSTGTTALSVGDKTKIGKFELELKTITSESDGRYTGVGFVIVPFLNDLKITVDFIGIKANAENKIYTGTVKVKHDNAFETRGVIAGGLKVLTVDETTASAIDSFISDSGRLIAALAAGSEISLPIGWDFEVDGKRIRLAIMDIDFTKTSAEMDAVALVDIPYISDDGEEYERVVSLGARELCFNPGGLGSDATFYVPEDFEFNPSDENVFAIKGLTEAGGSRTRDALDYTYLKWDCNGFKELHVAMQIKFSRETIVPEDEEGQPESEGNVIASANFNLNKTDEKFNLLSQVTFSGPFQIPKENANGWGFEASNVWLDLSTVANPPDITFPEGYVFETDDGRLANTWKGFWIQRLAIKAPHFVENTAGTRRTVDVAVNNFIIDPKVSFSFRVENLVPLSDNATVEGTHISLDNVFFDVMQNDFRRAGFDGKIALPIAEDKAPQMFQYQVMLDNAISRDEEVEDGEEPERHLGLVLSAKPAADTIYIKAKGFMMEGRIANSSFIELGYRGEVYTKFELNGKFGISTGNDEPGAERSFSLNMPSITIEGLKFDSAKPTNKFECNDCFHTSLASPQKTMSGFPLSLKSIDLGVSDGGKPMLSIEPQISFMGEDGGFSASAVINIMADLHKNEGKWQFDIEEVSVSKITLDKLEVSALTLSGFIEFYKEGDSKGTRGALAVQLPSGIAGSLNADFGAVKTADALPSDYDNNEKWYSYWYLEGKVMFGTSGLPFGAVALYGLGGGASYHMTQNNLPSGNELASAVGTTTGNIDTNDDGGNETYAPTPVVDSGTRYSPRYDSGLGLKFTALFGSPGGGKVYNFDVALEGEFNNEGGLRRFGFKGSARVMPDQTKPFTDTEAPIQAYVSFDMDRIDEPDNLLVQGHFILSLNFFDIIKGNATSLAIDPGVAYTGPRENIFVEAAFMSDEGSDEWYYVMGKPKENERGGIKVDLFGKTIASTKGYFVAGNALEKLGITLGMPSPVQAFLDIQNTAQGVDDENGGEFYGMEAVEDALQEPDGSITTGMYDAAGRVQGFQFGMSMDMDLSARLFPFYFNLQMAIGFDVLSKYIATCDVYANGERTGSLSPPGDDGWYSEGQFYAGINAEFGLFIDLWFIQKEFTIFQAAAALLLQGNIPNPDGFRGEGDIYFTVLGGLVDGQYHFEIEKGERCVAPLPGAADLLAQLDIIQDLKPSRGNDNSVFSVPQAAFSIAIEKELELPVSEDEIIVVKPFIKEWTLERNDNGRKVACEKFKMERHNTQSILQPIAVLSGRTQYKQYLRVEAWEIKNGRKTPIYNRDSTKYGVWYEDREARFTTGDMPDVVEKSNVLYTYPINNQKHFLKGETKGGKGYVVLKIAQNTGGKVFDTGGEFGDKDFIARFIKIDGSNDSFETPLELWHAASRVLKFEVGSLENDQTYLLQLLSRKRVVESNDGGILGPVDISNNALQQNGPLHEAIQATSVAAKLGYLKASISGAQERRLPDNLTINPGEIILYSYYFKTSGNDHFREKVTGLDWQGALIAGARSKDERVTVSAEWDEYPEIYDRYGYTNPLNRFEVPRLLDVNIKIYGGEFDRYPEYPINNYIRWQHQPNFYNEQIMIASKFRQLDLGIIRPVNQTYEAGVDFASHSKVDRPLSLNEVRRALNPTAAPPAPAASRVATAQTRSVTSGYSFAGGFTQSVASGIDLTPKVVINHKMPAKGYEYLVAVKENVSSAFFKPIDVWYTERKSFSFRGFDRPIDGLCHKILNKNYNTRYLSRYREKQLYRFIIRKPTAMQFLQEFDNRMYLKTFKLLFTSDVGYPKYPGTNRRRPISFILDYKYPSDVWPGAGTTVAHMITVGNNHVRIQKALH